MEAADIVKGKRTKRQRVLSPVPLAITANSSTIDGVADGIGYNTQGITDITHGISVGEAQDCLNAKNSTTVSPATSQEILHNQESTEEEEDMANCLILLAQGHFNDSAKGQDEDCAASTAAGIDNTNNNIVHSGNKFNSRRFMETTGSGGSGKGGYYVYECKTCCRIFPSFQALGGHRASHKKPKGIINSFIYEDKKQFTANSSDEDDFHKYKNISSLSLQLTNNYNSNNNSRSSSMNLQHSMKAKIHECSICGAEFNSGQALGGHMRRHRPPATAAAVSNSKNLTLAPVAMESDQSKKSSNLVSLDLDLNLPAPDDEKLTRFASNQQQQQKQDQQQQKSTLVFSGPALVNCHY